MVSVGVLGATGAVGQRFVQLIEEQPTAAGSLDDTLDVQQSQPNKPAQVPDVNIPTPPAPKAPPTPVAPPVPVAPPPTPTEKAISPKKENVPQPKPKEEDKPKPQTPEQKPAPKQETKPAETTPTPQPAAPAKPAPSANDILKDALSSAKKTATPSANKGGGAQSVAAALAGLGKEAAKGGGGPP